MPSIDLSLPQEIHPVAFEVYAAWSDGGKSLTDKTLEAVSVQLLALSADLQQLWYAVASLGALALSLEADGAPAAAARVRELVAKQATHFRPVIEELEGERGEGAKAAAAAFQQMFGAGSTRAAPRHDEAPPEGAVSLKSLMPNPALGPRRTAGPASRTSAPPPGGLRRGSVSGPASLPARAAPAGSGPPPVELRGAEETPDAAPEPAAGIEPRAPAAGPAPRQPAAPRGAPRPRPRAGGSDERPRFQLPRPGPRGPRR